MAEQAIVVMVDAHQFPHHGHLLAVHLLRLRSTRIGPLQNVDQVRNQIAAAKLDDGLAGPLGHRGPGILQSGQQNIGVILVAAHLEGPHRRRADFGLLGENGQLGQGTGRIGVGQAIQILDQAEPSLAIFVAKHLHERGDAGRRIDFFASVALVLVTLHQVVIRLSQSLRRRAGRRPIGLPRTFGLAKHVQAATNCRLASGFIRHASPMAKDSPARSGRLLISVSMKASVFF